MSITTITETTLSPPSVLHGDYYSEPGLGSNEPVDVSVVEEYTAVMPSDALTTNLVNTAASTMPVDKTFKPAEKKKATTKSKTPKYSTPPLPPKSKSAKQNAIGSLKKHIRKINMEMSQALKVHCHYSRLNSPLNNVSEVKDGNQLSLWRHLNIKILLGVRTSTNLRYSYLAGL
jgi:hypothetical protein